MESLAFGLSPSPLAWRKKLIYKEFFWSLVKLERSMGREISWSVKTTSCVAEYGTPEPSTPLNKTTFRLGGSSEMLPLMETPELGTHRDVSGTREKVEKSSQNGRERGLASSSCVRALASMDEGNGLK